MSVFEKKNRGGCVILNPNCSEAVMRIRVNSLTNEEREKIEAFLNKCNDLDGTEENENMTELEKEIAGRWYSTSWRAVTIFGIEVISISRNIYF